MVSHGKALKKIRDDSYRLEQRAKIQRLKVALREARAKLKLKIAAVRFACVRSRKLVAERRKERRKRLLAQLKEVAAQERRDGRQRCDQAKRCRAEARGGVLSAADKLAEERRYQRELARIGANNRRARNAVKKRSRAEEQGESDDEVRSNIEVDLLPLWERVKGSIRGSAHRSRTEAFLDYVHDNAGEVLAAQADDADREVERLVAELEQQEREYSRPPSRRTKARK